MPLGAPAIEEVYELVCESLERVPAAEQPNLLAKICLLLADELGDVSRVRAALSRAAASHRTEAAP